MVLELERASDSAGGLLKQIAGARSAVSDLVRLGRVAKKSRGADAFLVKSDVLPFAQVLRGNYFNSINHLL